jgi:hypothetical protein
VIYESWPWRQELLRDADVLQRWKGRPFSARRDFIVEKKVFIAAYAMRKLMESFKLSSDQSGHHVPCRIYPFLKRLTWRDRGEYYEHYDMERPQRASVSTSALFNLIIHSFIFTEAVTLCGHSYGFLVTSGHRRDDGLWEVNFDHYIALMRRVAEDDPAAMAMRFDETKQDWVVWRGIGDPPKGF